MLYDKILRTGIGLGRRIPRINMKTLGAQTLRGAARIGDNIIPNYGKTFRESGVLATAAKGALFFGGTSVANMAVRKYQNRLPGVPAGAPIMSGKRGIDANNLDSAGVSLAMHRNRRKF